jgi:hypothetical protein
MKTITIEVPEEVKNRVQRADVEQSAHKEIIATILERNLNIPADRMAAYQKEYENKFFAFEEAKTDIEREYVRKAVKNPLNWTLDYHTNIITVTVEE